MTDCRMKAIQIEKLSKKYYRQTGGGKSIKSFLLGRLSGALKKEEIWALKDLNLEVLKGETLGIIGANGAGKSTFLALLAGTTAPSTGSIKVEGRVSSLLELGAGFHPDLTGEENIYLHTSIMGISRKITQQKFQEIVDFSGIGEAVYSPVKFYSSGMYIRLGFSVAMMCEPDILLVDEVLSVGDENFRKKSLGRIQQFRSQGKTLLIVSHDLEIIKKMSDRVLFLNQGKMMDIGVADTVVDHYRNFSIFQDGHVTVREFGTKEIEIRDVLLKTKGKTIEEEITGGDSLKIEFLLVFKKRIDNPVVGFAIQDNLGGILFGTNTQIQGSNLGRFKEKQKMCIDLGIRILRRGVFYVSLAVHNASHEIQYHRLENRFKFKVTTEALSEGWMEMPCQFSLD